MPQDSNKNWFSILERQASKVSAEYYVVQDMNLINRPYKQIPEQDILIEEKNGLSFLRSAKILKKLKLKSQVAGIGWIRNLPKQARI